MSSERAVVSIVLIEDDENDADLVERALVATGLAYTLTRYPDGQSALAALDGSDAPVPNLFLVDLNLPKSDGISVLKAIHQRPRLVGVPIGVLTSSGSTSDRHRVELIGADRYVQ